jgi:hypothetical protein
MEMKNSIAAVKTRRLEHLKVHPMWQCKLELLACLLFVFFAFCPNAIGQTEINPTSEKTWSGIFLTISDTASGTNRNNSDYIVAVQNYSTTKIKSAVEKITAARRANGEIKAGLEDALIGHLLSWYASELSPIKGTDSWRKNRDALLDNRRAFVSIGLDSDTLDKSFLNMNKALRALAFPTVNDLN